MKLLGKLYWLDNANCAATYTMNKLEKNFRLDGQDTARFGITLEINLIVS